MVLGILTFNTKFRFVVRGLLDEESSWVIQGPKDVSSCMSLSDLEVVFFHPAGYEKVLIIYNGMTYEHKTYDSKVEHNINYIKKQYWDCVKLW